MHGEPDAYHTHTYDTPAWNVMQQGATTQLPGRVWHGGWVGYLLLETAESFNNNNN